MALINRWMVPFVATRPAAVGCPCYSITPSSMHRPNFLGAKEINFVSRISRNLSSTTGVLSYPQTLRPAWSNDARKTLLNQTCRHYSVLFKPVPKWVDHNLFPLQKLAFRRPLGRPFHISYSNRYDRLQNLEDAANRDRDNANAQAVFLQVKIFVTYLAE